MEAIGFDEVRLEPCLVPRWVRGDIESLSYSGPSHLAGRSLDILALGGSIPTPVGGIEGEVVRVTAISEMADRKDELKGKIVLLDRPFDATERNNFAAYGRAVGARTQGAINAAKAGALAVVVRSMASVIDDQPHTGAMRYDPRVPKIPACAVSTRGAEELAAALERGPVRLNLELNCESLEPVRSYNVVGDYYGRELPDEIVVVGGHLDGWDVGQGAHDDGAGCAHTLEPVRIFEELGIRPRRTIRCVMFMNEENGLEGARAYAATHAGEMDRHVMALESDSGGYTPRGFTCNANDPALAILRKVALHFADETADKVDGGGAGADISQMAPYGVPLVGFRPDDERYFSYHHTHGDTLDRVHPREINMGAGVISALTWAIAELSEPLPRNL
jgi:Zn-dependent M28 family amino/carboxypeptidase